jgi:hypothetical protein
VAQARPCAARMFQPFSQYDAGAHRDGAALPKSVQTFQESVL